MEEWASYRGVQKVDGFELLGQDVDGYLDVSAMTTQDIPANTPVLYIPNEMILSSNKAMEEFGRLADAEEIIVANGFESELRQFYLMIKILVEIERGQDSAWFPWLNSLPRFYSNGASMTPFCYRCIPPLLTSLCQKEREKLTNLAVKRVPCISEETKGNDELWKWAFQVVYTRGFEATDGSEDFCIVPMADMLNHGVETEVELVYDEAGNCYAQTTNDVPANSPLRMSYGDPSNPSLLLARYGFLDESSPATFCTPKIIRSRLNQEMGNLGYENYDRMLFYKDTGDLSEEVWDILLCIGLGEHDKGKQQEFYNAHMNGDYETKQSIHEQYYPQTAAKLLEYIDSVLQELDLRSGKAKYGGKVAGNDHPRLPLILRQNEFAKNTFLAVRCRYFES